MISIEKIRKEKPIKELLNFSIINIDKPSGPTSFYVSNYVRKSLNLNKSAHFGTLDPQVSGVLPIALNKACRLNEYLMHRDKEYIGIIKLHKDVSDEELKREIKNFRGKITQLPPIKSRVKRAERIREIKRFEILEREEKDILFIAEVQAGTYIRKLIHDLGERIGGAHMLELRRTKAGIFSEPSINLYDFDKALEEYKTGSDSLLRKILIPGEIVVSLFPSIQVRKSEIKKLLQGKPIFKSDILSEIPKDETHIAVFFEEKLIEIAKIVKEGNIIARPEFVLS